MAATHRLDGPALYVLLDDKRERLGISWRELGRRTGCNTGGQFVHLRDDVSGLSANSLLSLMAWLELPGAHHSITTESEVYE